MRHQSKPTNMLDFLFRFNVLNTAFSVIGNEIVQTLGALGGFWFQILYLWTLYFFFFEWWNNILYTQISTVAVSCFLVANSYLTVINRLRNVKYLNLLDVGFTRRLAGYLVKLLFPAVLWRYVWGSLNNGVQWAGSLFVAGNSSPCYTRFIKGLAFVLLCIIVRLCCQSSNLPVTVVSTKQTRTPPPVPQRPPSARIQAMRARQQMPSNFENVQN